MGGATCLLLPCGAATRSAEQFAHLAAGVGDGLLDAAGHRRGGAGGELGALGRQAVGQGPESRVVHTYCLIRIDLDLSSAAQIFFGALRLRPGSPAL